MTLFDISNNDNNISSTRWAFAIMIIFDLIIIAGVIVAGLVGQFIGKPIDNNFYGSVALLLGIPTTLISGVKLSQGWENKNLINKDK